MKPVIETQRLILRRFTLHDVDDLLRQVYSDPEAMRFLPGGKTRSRKQTEQRVQGFIDHWEQHGFGGMAVIHRADQQLIGQIGLQFIPGETAVEIFYAIARTYWGKGLTTEAAHAVLTYGFEKAGLDRIMAVAVPENIASQRIMQKIGMTGGDLTTAYYGGAELVYYVINRQSFSQLDMV
jgi:RimJ/RimL family protein N-acetyltransferase